MQRISVPQARGWLAPFDGEDSCLGRLYADLLNQPDNKILVLTPLPEGGESVSYEDA